MLNPFLDLQNLSDAFAKLRDDQWNNRAHEALQCALEYELIAAALEGNKKALPEVLVKYVTWLSQNWQSAPSTSTQARLYHLAYVAARHWSLEITRSNYFLVLQEILAPPDRPLDEKKLSQLILQNWLGVSSNDYTQLTTLLAAPETQYRVGPLPLLPSPLSLETIAEMSLGELASNTVTSTQIYIDKHFTRPFSVVLSSGRSYLFASAREFSHPLDAAKIAHEWAHIKDLIHSIQNKISLEARTTMERECIAMEAEFSFLMAVAGKRKRALSIAWLSENLGEQLKLFRNEAATLDKNAARPLEPALGLPLLSGVYVLGATRVRRNFQNAFA